VRFQYLEQPISFDTTDTTYSPGRWINPVPRLAIREHCAVLQIQSGKQRGRAVTFIVMSYVLHIPETQWQHRLRTLNGPAPTFLIHAQHQGVVGRVQIQPDERAQLHNEQGIVGQVKALRTMRFDPEESEVALRAALGDAAPAVAPPTLQWVEPSSGFFCRVLWISVATRSSSIDRGLPGPSSSYKPAILYFPKTPTPLSRRRVITVKQPSTVIFGRSVPLWTSLRQRPFLVLVENLHGPHAA
jgi:hypothetical protein